MGTFEREKCSIVLYLCIQIPPLRVKRAWHQEEAPSNSSSPPGQMDDAMKVGVSSSHDGASEGKKLHRAQRPSRFSPTEMTTPYSEWEARRGRHSNPLFSAHNPTPRPSGLDPANPNFVHVDPHVLATPLITDVDGDGVYAELILPVSYYFDSHFYGNSANLGRLNGLPSGELINYVGGGVVVIDLRSGKVRGQKLLGMTRATDNQPGYVLATPTVVRVTPGDIPVIAIGTAKGELHLLRGDTLEETAGFPLTLDSISAQVAVGSVFGGGKLEFLVGDYSGNVYCVDGGGRRVWEVELGVPVGSAVRLGDLDGDGTLEVVVTTVDGDLWILNSQTGKNWSPSAFPIHLGARTENSAMLLHTRNLAAGKNQSSDTVVAILGTSRGLYLVDIRDGCVHNIPVSASSNIVHDVMAGDIDPYHPGLELVSMGLDGTLICFAVDIVRSSVKAEAWSVESTGPMFFTHKSSSFYFTFNTSKEVSGKTFDGALVLYANNFMSENEFNLTVSMGTHMELFWEKVKVSRRVTEFQLRLSSPSKPLATFVTARVCSMHQQCRSMYIHVRFNLHFEDHLRWFLSLPFLSLCAVALWFHRKDNNSFSLPTSSLTGRTSGVRKNL